MSTRTILFYGLFMDQALLGEKGLRPTTLGRALVRDFRIHICDRATLVPSVGDRAHGVVMQLSDAEARLLYSDASVREYTPVTVRAELLDTSETIEAECYNLPSASALAGANPDYAVRLSKLVRALGFEPEYAEEIAAFATAR